MDENLKEILKNYITKDELKDLFSTQRSASEQFLEDHDRNFRTAEQKMSETQLQVRDAVSDLKAGLSKLSIMSDALSNIMRLQNDNYEAMRSQMRDHSDRLGRLEQGSAVAREEYVNLYGSIYGDADHPDQESVIALQKGRYRRADEQHEMIMTRFDHIEERQDGIEKQIDQFKRVWTFLLQGVGDAFKKGLPKILKWGFGMLVALLAARGVQPGVMNQIGEFIKAWLGLP